MTMRLFVSNLAYDVTEADLWAHFTAVGPLYSIALPTDRNTGKPRGFALVEFRERADAEEAIRHLNDQMFKGRRLAVSAARARDDHVTPGPVRTAIPRPPITADMRVGDSRDFGPDVAPRRRRTPVKGTAKVERGPKRPIYKRTTGPVRFNAEDDDTDEEEVRGARSASRRANTGEHDTT